MSALDTVTGSFDGSDDGWLSGFFNSIDNKSTSGDYVNQMDASSDNYEQLFNNAGLNFSDIQESTKDAFSSNNYGNYGGGGYSSDSPSIAARADMGDNIDAGGGWSPAGNAATSSQPKSMWDTATDFLGDKKNDNTIRLGEQVIGGVIGSYKKQKADEASEKKLQELREYNDKVQKEKEDRADARRGGGGGSSALDTLAAKDAIDQANKAKYSASISGLRPASGLINSRKKLTYVGGKPVFTDAGQLAQ